MTDYGKLTVIKLKDVLKERGLATTGLKAALVARLAEDDEAKASNSSQPQQAEDEEVAPVEIVPESVPATQDAAQTPANEAQSPIAVERSPSSPAEAPDAEELPDAESAPKADDGVAMPPPAAPASGTPEAAPESAMEEAGAGQEEQTGPSEELQDIAQSAPAPVAVEQKPVPGSQDVVMTTEQSISPSRASSQMPPPTETASLLPVNSTQTTIDPEEIVEDRKKRKRRSASPPPSSVDTVAKKARGLDGSPRPTRMASSEVDDSQTAQALTTQPLEVAEEEQERPQTQQMEVDPVQPASEEAQAPAEPEPLSAPADAADAKAHVEPQTFQRRPSLEHQHVGSRASPTSAKFKGLFAPAQHPTEAPTHLPAKDLPEDRDIEPAVHPATTALYIRNFMRPLQPTTLREHLEALARGAGGPDDEAPADAAPDAEAAAPAAIHDFFLDAIKTHCLVRFGSVAAAARVRRALHARVWPEERTRKALWADYVPPDKLPEWIRAETDAPGRGRGAAGGGKRWEVAYERRGGGDDGAAETVEAVLQEVDPNAARARPPPPATTTRNGEPAPASARSEAPRAEAPPLPSAASEPPVVGSGFKTLDDLFRSTAAKPKLYFQPVAAALVERRQALLDRGRGGGRGGDEMKRFTFEGEGEGESEAGGGPLRVVDKGPEFGFRSGRRGGAQRYAPGPRGP